MSRTCRIACLRIPELPIVAHRRVEAELMAALLAATPRIGRTGRGVFLLDASGWGRRGGESAFIGAARSAALAAGCPDVRIGVADTVVAARAATRLRDRAVHRVPPGADARFLAPLPVRALPLPGELLDLLAGLGLETIGELAALDFAAVEARLGAEGARAHRLARGLDDGREGFGAAAGEPERVVEVELPGPATTLEPILFLMKSCLDRLSGSLAREDLCIEVLAWTIETEDGPVRETIRPARPTRRVDLLLPLCRDALDGLCLPGRALGIRLEAEEVAPTMVEQGDLFDTARPDPDALATALARLQSRWGRETVVRPTAVDSHRPEARGRWEPVDLRSELLGRRTGKDDVGGTGEAGAPVPRLEHESESSGSAGSKGRDRATGPERLTPVLRLWPRPRPLELWIEDGRPGALALDGRWRSVRGLRGPERLSGEWWADPYRREYYRIETEAGDLLWVFYDPKRRAWFWHGWWD